MEHPAEARVVARLFEPRAARVEPVACLVEGPGLRATSASAVSAPALDVRVAASWRAPAPRRRPGGPCPGSRQLEHLAEPQQRPGARRPSSERARGVRSSRSRPHSRIPRAASPHAAGTRASFPRWPSASSGGRAGRAGARRLRTVTLDHARGALVEGLADREGDALVGDLLRDDVAEEVGLLGLDVERDEIRGTEHVEARGDVAGSTEIRVDGRQRRCAERPPENARDLERAPRPFGERVDPAEDQGVQAVGELDRGEGASSSRSTPWLAM